MAVQFLVMTSILFFCFMAPAGAEPPAAVHPYNLSISFDIPHARLSGKAEIRVRAGQKLFLATGTLSIHEIRFNGERIHAVIRNGVLSVDPAVDGSLSIRYEGTFRGKKPSRDTHSGEVGSVIDDRGIFLTGLWYPRPDGLTPYRLTALLPSGFEAVAEAERIDSRDVTEGREFHFDFPHPVDGINLIAARGYEVGHEKIQGVDLYTYFFREDRELAGTYRKYAAQYLKLYDQLLTPYPYKRFSVVENFLPTGYSMPTYTLLGRSVVRLPFIVKTSLGHEILHQWFGNSVFVDTEGGNWAEGLTTYLADQFYEEREGKGPDYRKNLLVQYGAYVNRENEFPLRDFIGRTDGATMAVGYGKAAMVFHLLRRRVGERNFFASLKTFIHREQFRQVSWKEIQSAFEKESGENLEGFFDQWVDRKGLPGFRLQNGSVRWEGDRFEVAFDLLQEGPSYTLDLPVEIETAGEGGKNRRKEWIHVDRERQRIRLFSDDEPIGLILDPEYDVPRRLSDSERSPVLAGLLGADKLLIVLPPKGPGMYTDLVRLFKERGAEERHAETLKDSEIRGSSLFVLGFDNPLVAGLFGRIESPDAGVSLQIRKNPWNRKRVVGMIQATSRKEIGSVLSKIFHYGKYSRIDFRGGKNVGKQVEKSEKGIRMSLQTREMSVVDLSARKTLSDVIAGVCGKQIVYVGENHDRFAHHWTQLQVIRGMYARNPKIAIGMEMFQRPSQKALDDYINGLISERVFLKRSEYFKRWGMDYNLYKPILDFAREKKIPVVALNLRQEITRKVSRKGMDSLDGEERKLLPRQIDFSDQKYRDRLETIFRKHKMPGGENLDFFYQAQILWDETMSQSIDDFLKNHPDRQMVVLTGSGHLAFGSGVPNRTFRRNGLSYAIILNDRENEPAIADYLVYPGAIQTISAPKMMVMLSEKDGKVRVEDFPKESVSKKAGLKVGDILLSLDGEPIDSIEDVKIALFYKKKKDTLAVGIERKRFLGGMKKETFRVRL